MSDIKVYGREDCTHCDAAKRFFDRKGIDFQYVDLDKNPDAYKKIVSEGYSQLPVVKTLDGDWQGSRPDKLIETAMKHQSSEHQRSQAVLGGPEKGLSR